MTAPVSAATAAAPAMATAAGLGADATRPGREREVLARLLEAVGGGGRRGSGHAAGAGRIPAPRASHGNIWLRGGGGGGGSVGPRRLRGRRRQPRGDAEAGLSTTTLAVAPAAPKRAFSTVARAHRGTSTVSSPPHVG